MPLSFPKLSPTSRMRQLFTFDSLVKIIFDRITTKCPKANTQTNSAAHTHKKKTTKVTRIIVSSCSAGAIFVATVSRDLWTEDLAIPGHILHTCAWSALGWHFKLYHLSQERHRLLWKALNHHHHPIPPARPLPLHSPDITPVLGSRAWKEKTKISPVGGCSRWPADVHIVFWLLIDLRTVKSSWSCKARSCLWKNIHWVQRTVRDLCSPTTCAHNRQLVEHYFIALTLQSI